MQLPNRGSSFGTGLGKDKRDNLCESRKYLAIFHMFIADSCTVYNEYINKQGYQCYPAFSYS